MKKWVNFIEFCDSVISEECKSFEYLAIGLASELGEVLGKIQKKIRRDDFDFEKELSLEIGDCLFLIAMLDKYCSFDDDSSGIIGLSYQVYPSVFECLNQNMVAFNAVCDAIDLLRSTTRALHRSNLSSLVAYIERVCSLFGLSLGDCADLVIFKLADRKARGVLQGSGDFR